MSPAPLYKPFFEDKDFIKNDCYRKIYASKDRKRYYTWDYMHKEVEVFNKRGKHLGAMDPISEMLIKGPEKGREINV